MIPKERRRLHTAIIGAGISGLSAAHRLLKRAKERNADIEIAVLDSRDRAGGAIRSERHDGCILERGPDSFITQKPWAINLCRQVNLTDHIVETNPEYRRTLIARGNRLHPLPEGFMMLAPTRWWPFVTSPLFSWPGKLRMAAELFIPAKEDFTKDESLGSFVRRRLGGEALEQVAQPMIGGIYTADPDLLSLSATMPRFLEMERKHGSVIKAMLRHGMERGSGARYSIFVTLDGGLDSLVDRLTSSLPPGALKLGRTATSVKVGRSGRRYDLEVSSGESLSCDAVIVATPAHISARILSGLDSKLSENLLKICFASSAVLNFIYRLDDIPVQLNGFGFVVPRTEKRSILACTFSNVKFPHRASPDKVVLRVFMGGHLHQHVYELDDAKMKHAARKDLMELLGITAAPLSSTLTRHPLSMPLYNVGHLALVESIENNMSLIPGLALAGNAYRGVGIPDCVRSGETAADSIFDSISKQPVRPDLSLNAVV